MENRKEQIIQAALKRFGHYGYNKSTMNELADDLGITKSNLYYYYPDKQSLFIDTIKAIMEMSFKRDNEVVDQYAGDFLHTLFTILENRSALMKKYYVLHLDENMDWIRGSGLETIMEAMHREDTAILTRLIQKAIDHQELFISDPNSAGQSFALIMRGLSIIHNIKDIVCKIPNPENADEILKSQKAASLFIFEGKIIRK